MTRAATARALLCLLWLGPGAVAADPGVQATSPESAIVESRPIDGPASRVDFRVRPAWRRRLDGHFDALLGTLDTLVDGRLRVRVSLASDSATFTDSALATRLMRSPAFFDAAEHPWIRFSSNPFTTARLHEGGVLEGALDLHGRQRRVAFTLAPGCADPGVACPIRAQGRISRRAFGMTSLRRLVGDEVDFTFDIRLAGAPTPALP